MTHRFESWNDEAVERVAECFQALANAITSLSLKLVAETGELTEEKFDLFGRASHGFASGAGALIRLIAEARDEDPEELAFRMNTVPGIESDREWSDKVMAERVKPIIDEFQSRQEPDIGAILAMLAQLGREESPESGIDGLA